MNQKLSNVARVSKGLSLCFLLCLATSCSRNAVVQKNPETIEPSKVVQDDTVEMVVFYPKRDGSALFQNKIMVDDRKKNPTMWMQLLVEKLSGAPNSEVSAVFPEKVDLYSMFTDKDILYVDFSANIQKLQFSDVGMQELALRAFLSSVKANFPYARQVKFLVEHEDRDVIFGHVYAQQPFSL